MRIYKPNEEIPVREYVARKLCDIENEIKNLDNNYIMNVNQEEYVNMLVAKHTVSFEVYYLTERLFVKYILHYVLNISLFVIHVIQADSPLSHFDLLRLKVLIRILFFPLQEPIHAKGKNKQEQ